MGIWITHPGGAGGTGGGSFPEGSTSNNFATQVAAMTLVHDIRFGTSATGGTQQIKNLTDLNNFSLWDPVDTADPTNVQMAYFDNFFEFAKYSDADASSVFVFNSGDLTLQPYSLHSWNGLVTEVAAGNVPISGTSILASSLGLSSTASLWIGRVVASPYGDYASRVTAFTGTHVTLTALNGTTGQALGFSGAHLMVWTAMTALPLNATGASLGDTTITLAAAPPGQVQNGMIVCGVDSYNYIKRYKYGSLATISGSTVTLTAPGMQMGIPSGGCVVFIPRTRTGQIVPKIDFPDPGPGCAWAFELDATWADNGAGVSPRTKYMNTLAEYTAAGGANCPMGGWGSFWIYMKQGVLVVAYDDANAEIDFAEQYCHVSSGPGDFSCAYHNYLRMVDHETGSEVMLPDAEGKPTYVKWNGTDQAYFTKHTSGAINGVYQQRIFGTVPSSFKRQGIWERDRVSVFTDNELRVRFQGQWASTRPGQLMINAALGTLSNLSNMHFPWTDQGLANCRLKVRSLKIWKLG